MLRLSDTPSPGGAGPDPDLARLRRYHQPTLGVEQICEQLQLAPSTYYAAKSRPPSARAARDAELRPKFEALFKHHFSVYVRCKLHKAARREGLDLGCDQVARLMRAPGLRGATRAKRRFTTKADPTAVRAPDLVKRDFSATAPDRLWVCDFTYCSIWSGVVYVSIATIGDSFDNALAETTNGLYKTELHRNPAVLADYGGHWKGLDDLEVATCSWVSWFNEERLSHGVGGLWRDVA